MRLDAAHNESKNKSIAVRGAKAAARELGGYTSGKAPYGFSLVPETRANADGRPIVIRLLTRQDDEAAVVRAMVAPATWYALQARLDGRPAPTAPLGPTAPALLSALGILFCDCGSPMKSHRHSARGFRSAYRCTRPPGARRPGQHAKDCTVSMAALDDYVARRIFALIATADTGDDLDTLNIIGEATRLFGVASADPVTAAQRGTISGELDDAERSLNDLDDDRKAGGYSGAIGRRRFLEEERALGDRIEVLTAELADIDAAASPTLPIEQWLGEPGTDPIGPGSWWSGASLAERRLMVTLFVKRITITKAPEGMTRPPIETRIAAFEWVSPDAID